MKQRDTDETKRSTHETHTRQIDTRDIPKTRRDTHETERHTRHR